VYLGRELHYAWQPDIHLRLVRRDSNPRLSNLNGHDFLVCDVTKPTLLKGLVYHYSYRNIKHHFEKTLWYARMGGKEYFEQGRRFSFLNFIINPWIAFIKLYIVRRGFLDGVPGFVAGVSAWLHVFLKYAHLWERQKSDE
jgi:hypothetical protein